MAIKWTWHGFDVFVNFFVTDLAGLLPRDRDHPLSRVVARHAADLRAWREATSPSGHASTAAGPGGGASRSAGSSSPAVGGAPRTIAADLEGSDDTPRKGQASKPPPEPPRVRSEHLSGVLQVTPGDFVVVVGLYNMQRGTAQIRRGGGGRLQEVPVDECLAAFLEQWASMIGVPMAAEGVDTAASVRRLDDTQLGRRMARHTGLGDIASQVEAICS